MRYQERLSRVRLEMEKRDIDLLFLPPSANMQYLTGIERDRPNYGNVNYPGGWVLGTLIGRDSDPIVMAPRMIAEFHMPEHVLGFVRALPDHGDPTAFVTDILAGYGQLRSVAIEDRAWAAAMMNFQKLLPQVTWSPAAAVMAPLRLIKDEDEIEVMRRASLLADTVLANVLPLLKVGMTEIDVMIEVHRQMELLGSKGPSFTTNIFTMGTHEVRDLRETTSFRPLRDGVSLSFDFGCVLEGYCSDFGRTVHIGEPSEEFRRCYDLVIAAHDAAIREMQSGKISAEGANAVARKVIEEGGYGEHFRHRLGHGIGLDVHEPAFLTSGDATVLQTGMAFTVEPSIYWPGHVGTRIEDIVIVRPGGGEVLNQATNTLHVVG